MKCCKFLLLALISMMSLASNAQKKATVSSKKIAAYKVPKLRTIIGQYSDSLGLPAAEAEQVIGLPLKVFDDKKNEYSVSSYQFMYKKMGVTEDEESGKVSSASSISSNRFKTTPLPAIWVTQVKEQLKKGEELFFFDIIAKDAQGRIMYAPNLKITVL